jgi:CheY-like chemotaxis protein
MASRSDRPGSHALPIGTYPPVGAPALTQPAMHDRIVELEDLCAEVYEAAVVLGLPQPLLDKLWMVAARGNSPQGFTLDTPEMPPLPDVALIHRASSSAALPPLQELDTRKTVVLVEDDPAMLDLIVKILDTENYDLILATSGDEALRRLEEEQTRPDLLITDLMMPGIDGRQLAAELRKRVPELRVLYQTGFTDVLFKQQQELESGAAFLEKPFTARGLLEAARFALFGTINPCVESEEAVDDASGPWRFLSDGCV